MAQVNRQRRALSQRQGALRSAGEAQRAKRLVAAWQAADNAPADPLTHGFHAYPARMHAAVAGALVEALDEARPLIDRATPMSLLDPFCGSGTVLLEALRRGHAASGVDLNPLALRIAAVQAQPPDARQQQAFAVQLRRITQSSLQRVQERQPVHAKLPTGEASWYAPHVLKELAGLHAEIEATPGERSRAALRIVFSALLVKVSRQQAVTKAQPTDQALRKGLVSEFFQRKGEELLQRWQRLRAVMPASTEPLQLLQGDARQLPRLLGKARFDALLSSPPYGGTYDYARHHARSFAWLGLHDGALQEQEIGARRQLQAGGAATWNAQLTAALRAMRAVVQPSGQLILLLGDAQIGGRRYAADEQVGTLAPVSGWRWLAQASQVRPDWTGSGPREEHLLWLEPDVLDRLRETSR